MSTAKEESIQLHLDLQMGEDAVPDELDLLTRQLHRELRELDVEEVDLIKDTQAPEGTKSAEVVTLGALAVAVLPTVLPKLIDFLQAWAMRADNRTIKVKTQVGEKSLEFEGMTLYKDKQDFLWIGKWGKGLVRYNTITGKHTQFLPVQNNPASISGNIIYSIFETFKKNSI